MSKTKHKDLGNFEEIRRKMLRRRRQLAFDSYPKSLQDFLTRKGLNPYEHDTTDCIEHAVSFDE